MDKPYQELYNRCDAFDRTLTSAELTIINGAYPEKVERFFNHFKSMENKYFTPSIEDIEWRPVKGYEGIYEVSSDGQVRRVSYLLKPSNSFYGYPQLTLTKGGKNSNKPLHRLVAEAFHDNPENKPTVNHKDGNKQNSHKDNLEWTTHSENSLHAVRTGLRLPNWQDGEKNPKAKLKKWQVLDIREKCETMTVSQVHKEFYPQLSYNTVYTIKTKRLWKNL